MNKAKSKNIEEKNFNYKEFIFPTINIIVLIFLFAVLFNFWSFDLSWFVFWIFDNKITYMILFIISFFNLMRFFSKKFIIEKETIEVIELFSTIFFIIFLTLYLLNLTSFKNVASISWENFIKEKISHIEKKIAEENKINPDFEKEQKYSRAIMERLIDLRSKTSNKDTIDEINSEIERLKSLLIE